MWTQRTHAEDFGFQWVLVTSFYAQSCLTGPSTQLRAAVLHSPWPSPPCPAEEHQQNLGGSTAKAGVSSLSLVIKLFFFLRMAGVKDMVLALSFNFLAFVVIVSH